MTRSAWGAGLATIAADGATLDTWYRWLGWGEYGDDAMAAANPELDTQLGMRDHHDDLRNVERHEQYPDAHLPHIVIAEASGIRRAKSDLLPGPRKDFEDAVAVV